MDIRQSINKIDLYCFKAGVMGINVYYIYSVVSAKQRKQFYHKIII